MVASSFPQEHIPEVAVGEESGDLDKVLERLGNAAYEFSFFRLKILVICVETMFILLFGFGYVLRAAMAL